MLKALKGFTKVRDEKRALLTFKAMRFRIVFGLFLSAAVGLSFAGCKGANSANSHVPSPYQWTRVADTSPWEKSYHFQLLTVGDTLWFMHTDGNWFSTDGRLWTKSALPNVIGNLAFLDYVVFKNKIFGLGHFEGTLKKNTLRPTVYISKNFMTWDSIEHTNLPRRFYYHPFVFADKIWIIGGEDDSNLWSDVINSPDGIHWTVMKDKLPFGPISNSQFLVFQNKLWMFNNDVWSSPDGYAWTQVSISIVNGMEVSGYAPVVFDERMWLIGCNRNGIFQSQVLLTTDGKHWSNQNAPWTPRGGAAASIFQNKIFMTGGRNGGIQDQPEFVTFNDIWEMMEVNN